MSSLILEIQASAIETHVDVASLLRKAKAAAMKLDQADASTWMKAELDGYEDYEFCRLTDVSAVL